VFYAPAALCAKVKSTQAKSPQVRRTVRHSLRDGVTAYFVISPAIGLSCHRPRAMRQHRHELTSASRCQDHTTSPSAFRAFVFRASKRPSHPAPNVRDDREAPLFIRHGTRGKMPLICPTPQAKGLRQINATGKSLEQPQILSSDEQLLDLVSRTRRSMTLLSRTRCSVQRCFAEPGPILRTLALMQG
jgi:hypothetical protein